MLGETQTARSVASHFPSLLTTAASTLRGSMPAISSVLGEAAARDAVRANPGLLAAGPKRILAAAIEMEKLLLQHKAATSAIRLTPQLLRTEPKALRASMRVLMCVGPQTSQARQSLALPVFETRPCGELPVVGCPLRFVLGHTLVWTARDSALTLHHPGSPARRSG